MSRQTYDLLNDQESVTLPNGAVLTPTEYCHVCINKRQQPEIASFNLAYGGQTRRLCVAHAQELLDMAEDEEQKGDWFHKAFRFTGW